MCWQSWYVISDLRLEQKNYWDKLGGCKEKQKGILFGRNVNHRGVLHRYEIDRNCPQISCYETYLMWLFYVDSFLLMRRLLSFSCSLGSLAVHGSSQTVWADASVLRLGKGHGWLWPSPPTAVAGEKCREILWDCIDHIYIYCILYYFIVFYCIYPTYIMIYIHIYPYHVPQPYGQVTIVLTMAWINVVDMRKHLQLIAECPPPNEKTTQRCWRWLLACCQKMP